MTPILGILKKVLFWSYDRGTWQYDIMCVLILAFIFFMPNSLIHQSRERGRPVWVSSQEISRPAPEDLKEALSRYLSVKEGRAVTVIEVSVEDDGAGYLVLEKLSPLD